MKIFISIALVIFFLPRILQGQEILDHYLVAAAENNPALKAKFSEYLAALEGIPQAGALPDPTLAFGYFIRPVETRVGPQNARISLNQMFPWFGKLKAGENEAVRKAKARYEDFEEAKSKLFYTVSSTYYDLYFLKRAMVITDENITILNSFRDLALAKLEAGMVSGVDELRIEMELADLDNRLALLQDRFLALQVKFNNLLNTGSLNAVQFPDTLWETEIGTEKDVWLDTIRTNNHQLTALDFEREALQFREEFARKSGYPNISIGLDYIVTGTGPNGNFAGKDAVIFPKIGFTLPLYRKKYKAMVNQAVALQQAVDAKKEDRINLLETMAEDVWKDYRDASRRLSLYRDQSRRAHQAISLLQAEYAAQNKNFEEILRMERKVLAYDLEWVKAMTDKNTAVAFARYLAGK